MKAVGIATVIAASGPGGYGLMARQQAEASVAAGLRLEAYTYLEFESDPEWWVREALARLNGLPVAHWLLDVEDTEHGRSWTPEQRIAYVQGALDAFAAAGVFAHIYSGGWYWRPSMANTMPSPASAGSSGTPGTTATRISTACRTALDRG